MTPTDWMYANEATVRMFPMLPLQDGEPNRYMRKKKSGCYCNTVHEKHIYISLLIMVAKDSKQCTENSLSLIHNFKRYTP